MKHILNLVIGLVSICSLAQVTAPQPSTSAKTEQVVGLTTVQLAYSRPSVKGRTIFGDLVPYNQNWRTGANANTTISFSDDVIVEGKQVKAGTYAIYSLPKPKSWTIYLYSKTDNWGLPEEWNEEHVAAQFEVKTQTTDSHIENFTLQIKDITSSMAKVQIAWEKTMVEFPIEVPTDKKVMKSITETLKDEPKARDYYSAAVYYLEEGKDINQAVEWIDIAMEMQDEKPFWMLRQQSLIYSKAGKKKQAIKIAEESLKAAQKAGNQDYVKMNKESIKEWKAK